MSGSAVRSSCAAGSLLILLLSQLRAGEGLKCYESSCLKDHTMKTLRCPEEEATQMTLSDCTPSYFRQKWSDLTNVELKSSEMKCIKLEGRGQLPKGHVGVDVIRMCAPLIVNDMCDVLSNLVSTKIEHSDVQDLKLLFTCKTCNNTDGCNSANIHMIPSLMVLIAVCFTALVTNG